jgi:hypothetical protein
VSTTVSTQFDLERFSRAVEERDSATQISMYGPDAVVTIADRVTTPSAPRVLTGRDQIAAWIEDVNGRDMTHRVEQSVAGPDGAAFTNACRYPDGTKVLCASVIALAGGLIGRQTVVQAWDE